MVIIYMYVDNLFSIYSIIFNGDGEYFEYFVFFENCSIFKLIFIVYIVFYIIYEF